MTATWYSLQFPRLVEPGQLEQLLRALHGMSSPGSKAPWVFQIRGDRSGLQHQVGLPKPRAGAAMTQATSHLPGLVFSEISRPTYPERLRAWRIWLSNSRRPLRLDDPESISRGVLAALAHARGNEQVYLQWWLGPVRRALSVPNRPTSTVSESWPIALATAGVLGPRAVDSEARTALRSKQGQPGWRAVGRIAVHAGSREREHFLLGHLVGALRTAEAAGVQLGVRRMSTAVYRQYRHPWFWGFAGSVAEFTALLAWPLGDVGQLPVRRQRARLLPVPRGVPRTGRVLAADPLHARPLALGVQQSLQHLHLIGPTGVGKSTVLLNLIFQDLDAGRAVVVIEPKGDLVADVLARIPAKRLDDVVLLDPTDAAPVGFNPLRSTTPELTADQLLHIFASTYPDSWGPRLSDILHASLLTLARTPGSTLPLLSNLLSNARYRRQVLAGLDDPLGVEPFWSWFESLPDPQRQTVTAPVLNKVRPLTVRPELRAVLGQAAPRFDLRDVFTKRTVLLVDLSKGRLGPASSRLLGTLLLHQLWQESLARVDVPASKRRPVMVVVDELQDYIGLPTGIGEILSQSRGLGVGWALAHQHLGQLPAETRAAVLANARSRMVFQSSAEDSAVLARSHPEISTEDFMALPAYEAYVRISTADGVTPYLSARTLPPPPQTSDPREVRRASRERYGQDRQATDQALQGIAQPTSPANPQVGGRRISK